MLIKETRVHIRTCGDFINDKGFVNFAERASFFATYLHLAIPVVSVQRVQVLFDQIILKILSVYFAFEHLPFVFVLQNIPQSVPEEFPKVFIYKHITRICKKIQTKVVTVIRVDHVKTQRQKHDVFHYYITNGGYTENLVNNTKHTETEREDNNPESEIIKTLEGSTTFFT